MKNAPLFEKTFSENGWLRKSVFSKSIHELMRPKIIVDIIIVNWNGRDYLAKAITPLLQENSDLIDLNVIISDNGSKDGSLELVRHLPVTIIENGNNIGFGAACNAGMDASKGKYVLLMNPDTESTLATIEKLVRKIETDPQVAVIGPAQLDENGNIRRICGRFPTFFTAIWECTGLSKILPGVFTPAPIMLDWDHKTTRNVDHIMGCYMLIRKSVIDKLGFMDDHYFVYLEDVDFSKRVANSGFKSLYFFDAKIFHACGGLSRQVMAKRLYYSLSSNRYYWKKHFTRFEYYTLQVLGLTIEPMFRLGHAVLSFEKTNVQQVLKAYGFLFQEIFGNLKPSMLNNNPQEKKLRLT